jgi:hypothetical protein
MTDQPWDFGAARDKCVAASNQQILAERAGQDAARKAAEASERYHLALACEIVRQHDVHGRAWTVCSDLARGEPEVARLRKERDIAEGVREAMSQYSWRAAADRKDAQRFADWSMRRDLAEGYHALEGPRDPVTYGRRS